MQPENSDVIDETNAARLKCKLVLQGANIPVTARAERILHDAVHDNLTGLPNREIFFDRLETAIAQAQSDRDARPTVIAIDIDRFRDVNEAIGIPGGDSILLTIARRLLRLVQLQKC